MLVPHAWLGFDVENEAAVEAAAAELGSLLKPPRLAIPMTGDPVDRNASIDHDAVRRSITRHVRSLGGRVKDIPPTALVVGLTAAALAPVVAPLLGVGAAGAAVATLIGATGHNYLETFATEYVNRHRARRRGPSPAAEAALEGDLQQGLTEWLREAGPQARALRAEMSLMLREVQAVHVALESVSDELKATLAESFGEVGESLGEFRWMLEDVRQVLLEIQANQVVQIGMQKLQLDLQRQLLAKTNLLLRAQAPRASAPRTAQAEVDAEPIPDQVDAEPVPEDADAEPPYKGLESFQPEDAPFFFGREALVAELSARLAEAPFLAVVGASGSGKSSVVRAGLLPAIWQGALPGSEDWQHVMLMNPGAHPLEELAVRFAAALGVAPGSLLADLRTEPARLQPVVRQLLLGQPNGARVVLVIDQFEEIFTLCTDEAERRSFIDALIAVGARGEHAVVVIAVRADFYARCTAHPTLAARLQDRQAVVAAMTADELGRAIKLPAWRAGLTIEPGLTEIMVQEIEGEPGALPLLSHALLETWKRRSGRVLTVRGYLDAGGVRGAIAKTADGVLEHQVAPEDRDVVRSIFLRLTELGQGTEDTRRRVRRTELMSGAGRDERVDAVLGTLVSARLVTAAEETFEVAHEALIREWPTLRRWLDEDREGLLVHRRLTDDANEWQERHRDRSVLYRESALAQAREWSRGRRGELNQVEREFLAASEARERRQRGLLVAFVAALAILAVGAAAAAGLAMRERETAQERQREADEHRRIALSRQLAAQAVASRDNLDLSLLLSLESVRVAATLEARSSLLAGMLAEPQLVGFIGRGSPGSVYSLASRPDGRILATGSADGTITLWDIDKRRHIGRLAGHNGLVSSVAFSPDGATLASGSYDDTIILWDVGVGRPIGEPLPGLDDVHSVAFSPDGDTLASGIDDGRILLWDVEERRPIGQPLVGHAGLVDSIAFSPDGTMLASGGHDGSIMLWNVADRRPIGEPIAAHEGWVTVAFRPDGAALASGGNDGTVKLWDVRQRRKISELATGSDWVNVVVFSPDGRLAAGTADGTIMLWNQAVQWFQDGPIDEPWTAHTDWIRGLAFSPDGATLVSGSQDGAIILWGVEERQPLGQPLAGHTDSVNGVAFSPDGATLATSSNDYTLRLWDVGERQPIGEPLTGITEWVRGVAFSPDGGTVASGSADGRIALWGVEDRKSIGVLAGHTDFVDSIAFSPDGTTLASAGQDGTVILWDVEQRRPIGQPLAALEVVDSVAFSPDGATLASGTTDGRIILWDVEELRPIGQPLVGHAGLVDSLAFSPDGATLASGSADGTVILWDVEQRRQIGQPLAGDTEWVRSVAFSPDGSTLASSGDAITLWDVEERQPIGDLLSASGVGTVAFSPDGATLASGTSGGTVILWEATLDSWKAAACRIAGRNLTAEEWERYVGTEQYRETCPNL